MIQKSSRRTTEEKIRAACEAADRNIQTYADDIQTFVRDSFAIQTKMDRLLKNIEGKIVEDTKYSLQDIYVLTGCINEGDRDLLRSMLKYDLDGIIPVFKLHPTLDIESGLYSFRARKYGGGGNTACS